MTKTEQLIKFKKQSDENVVDYLMRAKKIRRYVFQINQKHLPILDVEIAKIIQIEDIDRANQK